MRDTVNTNIACAWRSTHTMSVRKVDMIVSEICENKISEMHRREAPQPNLYLRIRSYCTRGEITDGSVLRTRRPLPSSRRPKLQTVLSTK